MKPQAGPNTSVENKIPARQSEREREREVEVSINVNSNGSSNSKNIRNISVFVS